MAKLDIQKAATDVTVYVKILDSSSATGAGLTGLVYNSASLTCYYVRPLGSATQLNLATQTVTGAHSDGGFVEVSSANMPGIYRLDLSDAICATGVNSVVVQLKGAANMVPVELEIQLTSYDPNNAVRLGLTALPNAAADAAGGLPISDAGGLDLDARLDAAISSRLASASITLSGGKVTVGTNDDKTGYALSSAGIQAIWDALTSALTTVGSIGKLLVDNINATISSRLASALYTTPPTANENADALLDRSNGVETGLTPRQAMRLSVAADAGKLSGAATTTVVIRNAVADSKDRITATVDADGNRTAITYDVS